MQAINKEKNFVSAVVYLGEEQACAVPFLQMLLQQLDSRFKNYEVVFVNDASRDGTDTAVKQYLKTCEQLPSITMINMSLKQGVELAMNAGLDISIGDFVYEFDSMQLSYPPQMILQAYDACMQGNDIVSVSPRRNRSATSALFYRVFNANSGSKYELHTDAFRILSRRGINRVHSISASMPYRKAAYAASGLRMETLFFEGDAHKNKEDMRLSRAIDSLALYTGVAYKASLLISGLMLLATVAALVYALVVLLSGQNPVEGWFTTMTLLSGGFFGIFLILSIVLKYLSLLLELVFKKQRYLVESVEKIV